MVKCLEGEIDPELFLQLPIAASSAHHKVFDCDLVASLDMDSLVDIVVARVVVSTCAVVLPCMAVPACNIVLPCVYIPAHVDHMVPLG